MTVAGAALCSALISLVVLIAAPIAGLVIGWYIGFLHSDAPDEVRADARCASSLGCILTLHFAVMAVSLNYAWGEWW